MRENESIRALKGSGGEDEKLFQKVGVSTVGQLLRYYPRDYDIYREPVSVDSLNDQETGAVLGNADGIVGYEKSPESDRDLRNGLRRLPDAVASPGLISRIFVTSCGAG